MNIDEIRKRQAAIDKLQSENRIAMVESIVEILNYQGGHISLTEIDEEIIEGYEFDEISILITPTGKTTFMLDYIPENVLNYENLMSIFIFLTEWSDNNPPQTFLYPNVTEGDWVRCNNCGRMMLLPYGADKCPECGFEGGLAWVDEERQEMYSHDIPNVTQTEKRLKNPDVYSD